jgi:hypothetical protein
MPRPRKVPEKGLPVMVKTTLILPEALWLRAKAQANVERRDLKDLLIEGLERVLKRSRGAR